jgi:citrate lyase subunit beta/citryl-CoA lyase
MVEKAASSAADQVFVDLEDAVAPSEKKAARALVVESLNSVDFGGKVVVVRVNDVTTPFCHGDVLELLAGAGAQLDCLMIPKVHDASHVHFVDHFLSGLEEDLGLTRPIGLELQIETPHGAIHLAGIAKASKRTQTIVFGPGDYAVSLGVPQLELGMIDPDYPGHQWHWVMSEVANHARAVGAQAIDGPYVDFKDREGYRESARRAKLLGFDGKWCIHPNQIEWANEVFTPSGDQYDYAERLLEAYREATDAGRGAVVFDGKMIDEATRKMAERVASRGRAAGLARSV